MKHIKKLLYINLALILSGCKFSWLDRPAEDFIQANFSNIGYTISRGLELQISPSEIVKIYGFDNCPNSKITGCVAIRGEHVSVMFDQGGHRIMERWVVQRDLKRDQLSLIRWNGYKVHQPREASTHD